MLQHTLKDIWLYSIAAWLKTHVCHNRQTNGTQQLGNLLPGNLPAAHVNHVLSGQVADDSVHRNVEEIKLENCGDKSRVYEKKDVSHLFLWVNYILACVTA